MFEVGPAFHGGEPEDQHVQVAGLLVGHTNSRDPYGVAPPVWTCFDAKADAEAVLAAIGAPAKAMIQRGASDWWHPGRSGQISLGPKNVLAVFGEVHPRVLAGTGCEGAGDGLLCLS